MKTKLLSWFRRKKKKKYPVLFEWEGHEINGATLDWGFNVVVQFDDGFIYPRDADRYFFKEFYPNNERWPRHPVTREKLPPADRL